MNRHDRLRRQKEKPERSERQHWRQNTEKRQIQPGHEEGYRNIVEKHKTPLNEYQGQTYSKTMTGLTNQLLKQHYV